MHGRFGEVNVAVVIGPKVAATIIFASHDEIVNGYNNKLVPFMLIPDWNVG